MLFSKTVMRHILLLLTGAFSVSAYADICLFTFRVGVGLLKGFFISTDKLSCLQYPPPFSVHMWTRG